MSTKLKHLAGSNHDSAAISSQSPARLGRMEASCHTAASTTTGGAC
jgi:hypothetical protein